MTITEARQQILTELLGAKGRLFVVSNRGPITFIQDPESPSGLGATRGSGGLVTALADLGRHVPTTWIAAGVSPGDRLAGPELTRAHRRLSALKSPDRALAARVRQLIEEILPGQDLRLRYHPIPDDVYAAYYETVANPFLWFLQHQMYALPYEPNIDAGLVDAWRTGYRTANHLIADAVVAAIAGTERPVVLIQDYHLYLVAERVREKRPDATLLHFNHIPWPPESIWQILPQGMRRSVCEGLLANDIVGLQTDRYADHFLETVSSFVRDAHVDRDGRTVRWRGRRVRVASYPISLDPDSLLRFAASPGVETRLAGLQERLDRVGDPMVVARADRIEPSKNALRGFLAFEELLQRRPDLRSKVRFVAVQAPTRTSIPEYAAYGRAVREVVARINGLATPEDQPIWIFDGTDYAMAIAALRRADVVLVNPVLDGMNLVAKEAILVGERTPVLILSETAGAAEQLAADALAVAPGDIDGTADQLARALTMPFHERRDRLRRLRASVREEDLDWWLWRQFRDLVAVRRGDLAPSRRLRDAVRKVEADPA